MTILELVDRIWGKYFPTKHAYVPCVTITCSFQHGHKGPCLHISETPAQEASPKLARYIEEGL